MMHAEAIWDKIVIRKSQEKHIENLMRIYESEFMNFIFLKIKYINFNKFILSYACGSYNFKKFCY